MPSWPRIPGGLLPTFQRSTQRECQDFTCLFGMAFGFPRPHPTTSSPSSTPQSWRLWAIQLYVNGFPIWDRRFSRASNRRPEALRALQKAQIEKWWPIIKAANVKGEEFQGRKMMKLPRRKFLHPAAGAAPLPAVSRFASAQAYPTRPVRIIVGFPPGSAPDIVARLLGQQLSDRLGQPFVIDNRPGASSNIATEAVVHAAPDGYTLLVVSLANVFNATLYDTLNFDFIRDIAPIASIDRQPFVLETHPSVLARTVPEFIAYAKANPGKINMASAGAGSAPHVLGELFKTLAGVDLLHVPYRGNPLPE